MGHVLLPPFSPSADWNANEMAGAGTVILDHEGSILKNELSLMSLQLLYSYYIF